MAEPRTAIIAAGIGVIVFFVANICLSLSLFFHGGEGDLVKRQRRILVAVWLIDIFLSFTLIAPIIVRYFFYKGYKELLNAEEEIEHYQKRTSKKKRSVLSIILSILGILLIVMVLLTILGIVAYNLERKPHV